MDPLHWIRFLNFHPIWIQHPRVILYYQFKKNNNGTGRNFQSDESLNGEFLSSALPVIYPNFNCVDPDLYSKRIRIRINIVAEYGSNFDPDPQHFFGTTPFY